MPIVSFVGRSNCGKTTLLEKLIPALAQRGYRVGVAKHTHHREVETDVPGTDSRRLWDAGADHVTFVTPNRVVHTHCHNTEPTLAEALRGIHDVDVVLMEGYKAADDPLVPKIEVVRAAHDPQPLPDLKGRIAYVTDVPDLSETLPCFKFTDLEGLLDFIEKHILQIYLEEAYQHWEDENWSEALQVCKQVLARAPAWAEAHNLRGLILDEMDRTTEAIDAYQEAVRLDPDFQAAVENFSDAKAEQAGKLKRPFGVWLLTIWHGIFAGVIPILVSIFVLVNHELQAMLDFSWDNFVVSTLLASAIIFTAIQAWRGKNRGRIAFVILLFIHYAMLAFNNYRLSTMDQVPQTEQIKMGGRVFRYITWIVINTWYFLSHRVQAFYGQAQLSRSNHERN